MALAGVVTATLRTCLQPCGRLTLVVSIGHERHVFSGTMCVALRERGYSIFTQARTVVVPPHKERRSQGSSRIFRYSYSTRKVQGWLSVLPLFRQACVNDLGATPLARRASFTQENTVILFSRITYSRLPQVVSSALSHRCSPALGRLHRRCCCVPPGLAFLRVENYLRLWL